MGSCEGLKPKAENCWSVLNMLMARLQRQADMF